MNKNVEKGLQIIDIGRQILKNFQEEDEMSELKSSSKKDCLIDHDDVRDDDDDFDANKVKKIRIWTFAIALTLVVLQVLFLKWWAILTGVVTIVAAYYVSEVLVNADELLEDVNEFVTDNKANIVLWVIAGILIIVQIFVIGWWTLLTGPLTIIIFFLLQELFVVILDYFKGN